MTTYLFLEQLFKNVLAKSIVMQGRFAVCPRYGHEINTDNLEAVLTDAVAGQKDWRWPGVIMMPPVSEMSLKDSTGEWERYRIELWFLTTTFYTGNNQIKFPNKNTLTSTHRIIEDWHDMKRCAKDFVLVLNGLVMQFSPPGLPFRIPGSEKKVFDPISLQGGTRLSGVRMILKADLWTGCEIEDYVPDNLLDIEIPAPNIHPTHLH